MFHLKRLREKGKTTFVLLSFFLSSIGDVLMVVYKISVFIVDFLLAGDHSMIFIVGVLLTVVYLLLMFYWRIGAILRGLAMWHPNQNLKCEISLSVSMLKNYQFLTFFLKAFHFYLHLFDTV